MPDELLDVDDTVPRHPEWAIDAVSTALSALCDSPICERPDHDKDAVIVLDALDAGGNMALAQALEMIIEPIKKMVEQIAALPPECAAEIKDIVARAQADEGG